MSSHRYEREPAYDDYRPRRGQYRDSNEIPYNDNHPRPYSRDQSHRIPSPRQQYSSSPHDRYRRSDSDEFEIKGASSRKGKNLREHRDDERGVETQQRGRSPSPRGDARRSYRDRDREGYRSPSYHSRSRSRKWSRSRSRRRDRSPYYGGPPSREVMLEGLLPDMVEEDISKELKQYHKVEKLDDVRVIRDRQTKISRCFGFLKFPTLEDSKSFVERNYPMIYLYGNTSTDNDNEAAKVRIVYSRERDERRTEKAEGDWICKICTFLNFAGRTRCHRCQTPQIDMASFGAAAPAKSQQINSGDSDASPNGTPSQFLLIRGLEPTVSEDLLAKGIAKLYKPARKQSPPATSSLKKGTAKVASTTGDSNLGAKVGSLRRVLLVRDRRSNESWRYGFAEFATIDDAQAALTRYNSFEKFTISSKPVTADYVHAGIFVPVLNPTKEIEQFAFSPLGNSATKLVYWDEDAWASELVVSTGSPRLGELSGDGQARSAVDEAAAAAEKEGLVKPSKEMEAKAKKRKADNGAAAKQKKTAPAHLQFWSNRHAELHGVKNTTSEADEGEPKDIPATDDVVKEGSTPLQSYADLAKKCCYLCSRQFKTEAEVNKHERLSDLHRENMKNGDLLSKAKAKMAKAGVTPASLNQDSTEYRDRAKERRAAFGGSKRISLPLKKTSSQAEEKPDDDASPVPSKGASLLGKMGWSEGRGLGAQGTGVTAPIATDMYVQGVGLGAQGGKIEDATAEAERNTRGDYGDFLERTRDKAKERYEKMA